VYPNLLLIRPSGGTAIPLFAPIARDRRIDRVLFLFFLLVLAMATAVVAFVYGDYPHEAGEVELQSCFGWNRGD
jgi:hypothetical protein